jgi:hypothetical protein
MKAKIRIVTSKSLFGFCRLGVVLVCLSSLFVVVGSAQAVMGQQQTITQPGGSAYDEFGWSVALSADGNTAIVGAFLDDVGSNVSQGSATIFVRTSGTWTQQERIVQSTGEAGDCFGYSVALSSDGNTAIVGAPRYDVGSDQNQGIVAIFTRSDGAWTQQRTIPQSDGAAGDSFGSSVALSGDGNTAIVGAYGDNVGGFTEEGSVTIFTRSGGSWTQQQRINAYPLGAAGDRFGWSVALSGDGNTAIVGADGDDLGGSLDQGSATVYTRSGGGWYRQQTITQINGLQGDKFGYSVALSDDGDTTIVGALSRVNSNTNQGSATVYTRSGGTWTQQQTITQNDGAANDMFGYSVALSSDGNTAIVGAFGDDSNRGSATVITHLSGTWIQQTITQTGGAENDQFGRSVALSDDGNTTIVGAPKDDVGSNLDQGSATVFEQAVAPGVPTSVSATSGANAQSVVSWTAPGSDGGLPITGYTVLSSGGQTCSWTSGALSCTVTGLTNGTPYTFTVTATNVMGTSSASSASSSVTPRTTPGLPTSVAATSGANGQSVVSWIAPASDGGSTITGYTVTANPGGQTCSWTSGALSCTVTGLTNGTSYTFTVTATNAAGTSSASDASSGAVPRTVPGLPRSVSATVANASSVVSWSAPLSDGGATITRYTVTASPGGGSCSPASVEPSTPATTCTVAGLTNGQSYTFTVTAENAAGTGSASDASSGVVPRTVPGPPTGVVAARGNTSAVVSWSAPLDNGGATIIAYTVTASSGGVTCSTSSTAPATPVTSCTVSGLSNGTSYTFTVQATNVAGTGSASSASSAVTPVAVPDRPTIDSVTVPLINRLSVAFTPGSNNGSVVSEYTATCASSNGGTTRSASGASSPLVVSSLTTGKSYTCTVTATSVVGTSPASEVSDTVVSAYLVSISSLAGTGSVAASEGDIACPSTCSGTYLPDSVVTLVASPASGWVFSSWGGACSGTSATCTVIVSAARDVTVSFVQSPTSGGGTSTPGGGGESGAAPSPTINISNNITVNVTVTTPVNVQWSPPVVGRPTTASFTAAPQTTYSISATTSARAAKMVRGSCRVKVGKAMCTIKIPAKGKWVVAITPKKKGKVGKPAKKTFRV